MGFNKEQPRVPAGSPGGGRWIQAEFGTFESSVDDVRNQLAESMNNGEYEYYGIRVEDLDDPGKKGDSLPDSRIWVDGEPTGETLNGTSVLGIESVNDVGKGMIAMGLKDGARGGYFGKVVYLVGGNSREYGEDVGEWILRDAKIVSVYTRDKYAFSNIARRI